MVRMKDIARNAYGFTLIELLIVISIIGMLAAIVLGDLGAAKIKAQDAIVQQNLNSIRTQAGIFYDSNNTYSNLCLFPKIAEALNESAELTGNTPNCDDIATSWAAEMEISTGEFYCIDWEGNASTTIASKGAATTVCY